MRRSQTIIWTFILCLGALTVLGQTKGDFSDWNVPPPTPTGTIPKSPGNKLKPVQEPTDVPAPTLNAGLGAKNVTLSPLSQTAPDVQAPQQPAFPSMPFQTPDIPLPAIPQAMQLPNLTLHDHQDETGTDMPEPQSPEMPELPQRPTIKPSPETGGDLKIPVVPAIITQPAVTMLPTTGFPFMAWPAPAIPENSTVSLGSMIDDNNKDKNDIKEKPPKQRRGG